MGNTAVARSRTIAALAKVSLSLSGVPLGIARRMMLRACLGDRYLQVCPACLWGTPLESLP